MVAQWLCKPRAGVRFSYGPPNKQVSCKKKTVNSPALPGGFDKGRGTSPKVIPNLALKALLAMHGSCKPENTVRFCMRAPSFSPISEMASPVVWDHEAQVRFLHRRPVFIAGIQGIGKSHKLYLVGSNPTPATIFGDMA